MASTDTPVRVTIQPSVDELKSRLANQRQRVTNLRSPMSAAAVYLDQWVQRNFKSEGEAVGGWKPFSEKTLSIIARTDKKRTNPKLLQRSGALRLSYLPRADDSLAGIGSELPYAADHQYGKAPTPARPMLPLKNPALSEVTAKAQSIFNAHALRAIK